MSSAGNVATAVDPVIEQAAVNISNGVTASMRVGRPLASNTAIFDPAYLPGVQSPTVYAWRINQETTEFLLHGGGKFLGAVGTLVDGYGAYSNFSSGNNLQGSADLASASAGAAMFIDFGATAPFALPALMFAKLIPSYTRFNAYWLGMGAPMSNF